MQSNASVAELPKKGDRADDSNSIDRLGRVKTGIRFLSSFFPSRFCLFAFIGVPVLSFFLSSLLSFFLRSDKVESGPISTAKFQVESGLVFLLLNPVKPNLVQSCPIEPSHPSINSHSCSISIHITLKKPTHLIL
jgi:hypothetical protein